VPARGQPDFDSSLLAFATFFSSLALYFFARFVAFLCALADIFAALTMLVISFVLLLLINLLQFWVRKRSGQL